MIIPVFNGAAFIGVAVDSALSQTYRSLEVLVVDDGSTDRTRDIVARYAARDPRVRLISQANGGVARARNRGIAESHGEFVAPLDADDLWEPTKIALQMERMLEGGSNTGLVYCWWVWVDEQGTVLDRSPRWRIEGDVFDRLLQINFTGNASVPLFRKSCVVEAGGYNEAMAASHAGGCEDWEIALRVASKYEARSVPELLVGYRRRAGSMSTACGMMWRSHQMLIRNMQEVRPGLDKTLIQRADRQFALYLAGLSFWSGNTAEALRWGLRSGWKLPIRVAPFVVRLLLGRNQKNTGGQRMLPGVILEMGRVPGEPLLPYDKIYGHFQDGTPPCSYERRETVLRGTEGSTATKSLREAQLVSVVIPAYNAEATISDTLRSVRSQTHRNLEILVVDDGSVDDTRAIVEAHLAVDGRVQLIAQENRGVAAARNAGWQAARSELIAFVDADDLWAPTKIEKQLDVMLAGGPRMGLVYTWFSVIDESGQIRYKVKGRAIEGDVLIHAALGNFVGHASSPLIRREALIRARGFDSCLRDAGAHGCEDLQLYQRVAAWFQYGLVPEHLTGYRMARFRMSSDRPRMLRSFQLVAEETRRAHPELSAKVDDGVRAYVLFLVGEAAAAVDVRQVWRLLRDWVPHHPLDGVLIPLAVLWSKMLWRFQSLGRAIRGVNPKGMDRYFATGAADMPREKTEIDGVGTVG